MKLIQKIKWYFKLYGMFLSQYIKAIMHSRTDFFIGFFAFFLIQFGGIAFLALVFRQIPSLLGWSFYELLFIYGFANIPRGIDHMFTDYLWILSGDVIVHGEFDRYFLRPIHPLFQIIAQRFQPDGIGEMVIGILLVIYASGQANISFTPGKIILMFIMILLATLIYTSIKLFLASLAFWIKRSQSILFMFYSISDFAKYPITIYHKFIRTLITYIIPFALTAYIPASYFLGASSLIESLGLTALISLTAMTIALFTFNRGMKRYESAGN
ncbi:ABC transporter permease [Fusibacter bizertensis]